MDFKTMLVFPLLKTKHLRLRKIQIEDIPSMVKYANNKEISDQVLNIPYPYDEPTAVFRISYVVKGFETKSKFVFSIILISTEEFIGEIGLHLDSGGNFAELGYWLGQPFWKQGLMTEAVEAVIKFGFEKLMLNTIFANCKEGNTASQKVFLKNGYKIGKTTGTCNSIYHNKRGL